MKKIKPVSRVSKCRFPSEAALLATLKRLRNPKCNKCYAGQNGFDTLRGHWRVCLCVDQNLLSEVSGQMNKLHSVDKKGVKQ